MTSYTYFSMGMKISQKKLEKAVLGGGASLFNSTSIPPQTRSFLPFSIYFAPLGKILHDTGSPG